MIALDTNVIARFYVDDPLDVEAQRQRPLAKRVFKESKALYVPLTVVLELEWVLRAFYDFGATDFVKVIKHLSGLSNVNVESQTAVLAALQAHAKGLDFADALHLSASRECEALVTFDDRKFSRRAKRLALQPKVIALA